jgi:hypothetical protein
MAQAKGALSQVVIDFETTYGADPTSINGLLMPFNSFGLVASQKMTEPATIRAKRDAVMPIFGNIDCKGPAKIPVDLVNFGYWLRALLGAPQTSGSSPTYTHIFKPAASIESMVVELGFTDIAKYLKFNGVKVDKCSLEFGGDKELIASLDLVGAKETPGATIYDATPTAATFTRLNQNQVTLEEGGSAIAIVQDVKLDIANKLDDSSFVIGGGGIRGALSEGDCLVTGSLKALFQDITLYNKAVNGTESSLKIILTSGTYSLTFFIPELQYERGGVKVEGQGGVYVEMKFSAYYENNSDTAVLKATLVNDHASYAA